MSAQVPTTMRALMLVERVKSFAEPGWESCFQVQEVPVPVLEPGQVLLKIAYSPIHPMNFLQAQGHYRSTGTRPLPQHTGNEASGTVVAAADDVGSWLNKRVAGYIDVAGTWAEYVALPATNCIALPDHVSFEDGATAFVNPLTVVGMVEIAQTRGAKAIINTAAASALGKMLVRHAREEGLEVIAVVRRPEQVKILEGVGAKYIVDTSVDGWEQKLSKLAHELGATVGFDPVGGSLFASVLTAMPPKSILHCYGLLSGEPIVPIKAFDLMSQKTPSGYIVDVYLGERFHTQGIKIAPRLNTTFKTNFRAFYPLEGAVDAIRDYLSNMSNDKIAFKPNN
ncbi:hypothetical protein THRCLA_08055 [Thraustotheca clavata]|uniref:Enoyl reductase (ER) domain-containing protein n=1 Tax=Thraustotheca clavata TaxID=74557 RepID=A0A1V9ZAF2_9STRA|nr:hypothetical protein THRCLA_08055 [Thraustotheca clavata]